MAYFELKVGSIIVYPDNSSLEVVTGIACRKCIDKSSKWARTKLLHHDSKSPIFRLYCGTADGKYYYLRKCRVVNLAAEELAKIRGDLNMLSKLLPKATSVHGVFSIVVDNEIPELIEGLKPKLDISMEVRRIAEDSIYKNPRLKHLYKIKRLSPDLRSISPSLRSKVSVLAELLLIPGATKDSIDAAMTMNFGVGVFNVGVNV